jgi:tetratricopeptide (TPR) repeat protein
MHDDAHDATTRLPRQLVVRVWAGPQGFLAVVDQPQAANTEVFTDALALCRHVVGAETFDALIGGRGQLPHATIAAAPACAEPSHSQDNPRARAALHRATRCWLLGAHAALAGAGQTLPAHEAAAPASVATGATQARLLQLQAWAQGDPDAGRQALAGAARQLLAAIDPSQAVPLLLDDACFAHLLGQHEAAGQQFDAATAMADTRDPTQAWHLFSVKAWRELEAGRWQAAEDAARQALDAASGAPHHGATAQAMSLFIAGQAALSSGRSVASACAALQGHVVAGSNPRAGWCAKWLQAAAALQPEGCGAADGMAQLVSQALAAQHALGGGLWFGLHSATAARLAAQALRWGIEPEAATALVQHHHLAPPPDADEHWPWPVRVHGHGVQRIAVSGRPAASGGKVQRRPLDLLDLLVALGGQAPAARLADRLWPEADGDRAMAALEIALRRLRKLLGHADTVLRCGGALSINRQRVWVEALAAPLALPRFPPPEGVADRSLRFVLSAGERDRASVGDPSLLAGDHAFSRHGFAEGP